ncbi:hypothetical protein Pint_26269 [Pistacia integerrima]|uniref:Uncharacterized protein n=1 Tax=Pistacia integerrima TaxID=434235 RepID=A0ACC0YA53_9ROSI|nr:hypothetical protein Pint_26269 [Pistacia integerrima]
MEIGMNNKFHHLEEALNRLSNVLLANPESSNHGNHHRENQDGGQFFEYQGESWLYEAQFFEYQGTIANQKVSMAAYHLEGEANQWWQWLRRTLQEKGHIISWEKFEVELWACFGPSGCEVFDEALSRIRQLGTLRDFQREFEKLGNKEAINLARMRDEQLTRQQRFTRTPPTRTPLALPQTTRVAPATAIRPIKRFSWEEISTHNFISNRLANMLRLPVIPMETFPVRVANGERLTCLDLVLGVQWLEMLGSVVCNWKQLTMDFIWENQDHRLQGVDMQTIQAVSPKEISKEFRRGHVLFAMCFQPTMGTAPPDAPTQDKKQNMQWLLKEYEEVYHCM